MKNKTFQIYIKLLDGTSVLVPVKAMHINNNNFKIIDENYFDESDVTSIWEFFPNDIVKCSIENDNFKAKDLISSNLKNRDFYTLIFKVVQSFGEFQFEKDILNNKDFLRELKSMPQSKHPIFQKWLKKNK